LRQQSHFLGSLTTVCGYSVTAVKINDLIKWRQYVDYMPDRADRTKLPCMAIVWWCWDIRNKGHVASLNK